jgi:hypothetical protein
MSNVSNGKRFSYMRVIKVWQVVFRVFTFFVVIIFEEFLFKPIKQFFLGLIYKKLTKYQ